MKRFYGILAVILAVLLIATVSDAWLTAFPLWCVGVQSLALLAAVVVCLREVIANG